jgi:ABC-type bacteriocin/lantibiotic exporter with double-glycine peptidase domain
MKKLTIINSIRSLRWNRNYVIYSIVFGFSSLALPLGIQFLVNNLALSGIWQNTVSFLILIAVALVISQIVKHSQVILIEYIQREVFLHEIKKWKSFKDIEKTHYYFEVINSLKSFSKSYASLIEMTLVIVFGILTILTFHPVYLFLVLIIVLTFINIYKKSEKAIKSSIYESTKKYDIYHEIATGKGVNDVSVDSYLEARDDHFFFTRKNSYKISILTVCVHLIFLAIGCYLILANQLSVGQLVSAELILSGIFSSISKLPQTLESVYDYETSQYKIHYALAGNNHE